MASVEEIWTAILLNAQKILEGNLLILKQHFKNIFSIELGTSSDFLNSLPENYKTFQQENYNSISLTVQITPPSQSNDLLNFFPNTQIPFQEVLPS